MKRILMVVQEYFPRDPRVRRYVNSLNSKNIPTDVICIGNKGDKRKENYGNGIIIRKILPKKRASKIRYMYEYLSFWFFSFFTINRLTNEKEYSIIHFHTLPDFLVFSGAIAKTKAKGVKLILDLHEILPEFYAVKFGLSQNSLFFKLLTLVERISVQYADSVITVNDAIKKLVEKRSHPKEEILVVMNTVDEQIVSRRIPKNHNDFNIFYIGTILEISGLQYVIKALSELKDEKIKLHIVGEGPYKNYLKLLSQNLGLQKKTLFYKFVDQKQLHNHLAICDVGIIPQDRNIMTDLSFSNKLSEFIYHKIPVIATELEATKDYFDSDCIYFTKSGDIHSIEKAILELYSSKDLRKKLSDNAYSKYENIKWCIMQKRYIDLIDELLKK